MELVERSDANDVVTPDRPDDLRARLLDLAYLLVVATITSASRLLACNACHEQSHANPDLRL